MRKAKRSNSTVLREMLDGGQIVCTAQGMAALERMIDGAVECSAPKGALDEPAVTPEVDIEDPQLDAPDKAG